MYTVVSQSRWARLAGKGHKCFCSPSRGHIVEGAPYQTGDDEYRLDELPDDAFEDQPTQEEIEYWI